MDLRVHLKICEACGCLWYRAQFEARVYCSSCFERFSEFPAPQVRKRRGRPRKVVLPTVFAVACETREPVAGREWEFRAYTAAAGDGCSIAAGAL